MHQRPRSRAHEAVQATHASPTNQTCPTCQIWWTPPWYGRLRMEHKRKSEGLLATLGKDFCRILGQDLNWELGRRFSPNSSKRLVEISTKISAEISPPTLVHRSCVGRQSAIGKKAPEWCSKMVVRILKKGPWDFWKRVREISVRFPWEFRDFVLVAKRCVSGRKKIHGNFTDTFSEMSRKFHGVFHGVFHGGFHYM